MIQHPSGKGRGNDHRNRQAEQPKRIGARSFGTGKPVREKNQRCGMNAAFGYSEEQTKQQEFVIGAGQTTTDGKDAPCDQQDADELLGAPVFGQMAAWYLQREVTPEENPGNGTCLLRIQMQVSADSWQGKRD